ncbi:cyclic lactone autoinducer peptide [uncultured Enterococcus sp.]|nr:cyclic lactone autoinducer peptide [uncultured Enterococcus sp.]
MGTLLMNLFVGIGTLSIQNCCLFTNYEPEIPEELKS